MNKYGFSPRSLFLKTCCAVLLVSFFNLSAIRYGMAAPSAPQTDWHEQYAYAVGMQAYIFGFPWILLPQIRWQWVTQPTDPNMTPCAPLNRFWHGRKLSTAEYRGGGSPNNDTMYSIAWLDLGKEPIVLSVPAVGERYYTFEMASMDSDNFAYVGSRTTGTEKGDYAIIGPGWTGKLPDGVKALPPSRTPSAVIFGRTLVYGPEDVENVRTLQDRYHLTPLSQWGKKVEMASGRRDVWKPADAKTDPLAVWKTMNRAMSENPPHEAHQPLVRSFSRIGVGPGQDVEKMDDATKRGLIRAAKDGMKLLRDAREAGLGKNVNGWTYPAASMGRAGLKDDFLVRAASQCLGGIISNDPEEGVYLNTWRDAEGRRLSGENRYVIRFAPAQIPKVEAFWSVTLYGMDDNFVANPLDRYKLGTYPTEQLKPDPDGSLTLYVQKDTPGKDKESNWLPAPEGDFRMVLRTYVPSPEIVKQEWAPPPVMKVE